MLIQVIYNDIWGVSVDEKYQVALDKLGKRLKEIRKSKGLTMREVADNCQMDENNYGRFEKGQTNPTIKSLVRICEVLEVELQELFHWLLNRISISKE